MIQGELRIRENVLSGGVQALVGRLNWTMGRILKCRGPNVTKIESKQKVMFFFHFSNQEKSDGAIGILYKTVFSENKTSDYSKNSFLHFFFCPCAPFVDELT